MGVQVVQHDHDLLGRREDRVGQGPHERRPIDPRALLGHLHVAPARSGATARNRLRTPGPLVLGIVARGLPRLRGLGGAASPSPIACSPRPCRPAVAADPAAAGRLRARPPSPRRTPRSLRAGCTTLFQPRLEYVFLSVRAPSHTRSRSPSSVTKRSASSRKVQRSCPAGGVLQARATKCASLAPSIFAGRRGAGRRDPHFAGRVVEQWSHRAADQRAVRTDCGRADGG